MCLEVDPGLTGKIRRTLRERGGACLVYKFLALRETDDELISPFQTEFVWRPGWHEAAGEPPSDPEGRGWIDSGAFHVYLEPEGPAPRVEFLAREVDFLGAGSLGRHIHVAFRRLHLSEEAYLGVYREMGRVPPPQHTPCGRRVLTDPEWDAVASWVTDNVAIGAFRRALVDVTPRRRDGSTDPVVWVRPSSTAPAFRNRRRDLRSVPVDRVIAGRRPSHGPPEAA